MKVKLKIIAITLMLAGCEEKRVQQELSEVALETLKIAVRDARHAEREERLAKLEAENLRSDNLRLRGAVIRMEAEAAFAESQVENARKLGIVEANLRHVSGE